MKPNILVLATGGTITSTMDKSGASPTHDIEYLLNLVPEVDQEYTITAEQFSQVPSSNMSLGTVIGLFRRIEAAAEDGIDGTVVINGTDTMEESAYLLDLIHADPMPVIFTGAQRRSDEVSPDGPANLLTAITAAGDEALHDTDGVYIAFNDRLHAARHVRKLHTSNVDTFRSPGTGPIAEHTHSGFRFFEPSGSQSGAIPLPDAVTADSSFPPVEIVKSGLDMHGRQMESAIKHDIDGLIVEGTGLGNVSPGVSDGIRDAIESKIPVVLTSRCMEGTVAPVYGTRGGGRDLRERGVIFGGDLPSHKARLKLILSLMHSTDRRDIRVFFEDQ